jgi:hypothetical protein
MIRTRDQLLNWIAEHVPTRAIRRALAEGTVEVLGGFSTSPPCWIVRVTSVFKHRWDVSVTDRGEIKVLETVPWQLWVGGKTPLYHGDNPEHYAQGGLDEQRSA